MTLTTRMRMTVPTIIVAAGVASGVLAQTTTANPHHPNTTRAQANSGQGLDAQPAQPGMMRPGMTGEAMVGQGMLGGDANDGSTRTHAEGHIRNCRHGQRRGALIRGGDGHS